jgi:hypothetical protein
MWYQYEIYTLVQVLEPEAVDPRQSYFSTVHWSRCSAAEFLNIQIR